MAHKLRGVFTGEKENWSEKTERIVQLSSAPLGGQEEQRPPFPPARAALSPCYTLPCPPAFTSQQLSRPLLFDPFQQGCEGD